MDAKTILEAWQKTMIKKSDCLSQYLAERFHAQAIDELEDEGYKQNTVVAG